ncbi:hypothetical protein LUZ61_020884 [Rhynchospora tenuis]|uniref:Uncharacterized protein n=1 Tax=Rhynchospora tenuis TaxID=198213 RepID=A0AAD5ZDU1_9POAL|nr:hypothetical protein LUZ61_020884 [Rhynchospora tenuis]
MENIYDSLSLAGLNNQIKVSTVLSSTGAPLFANVYPYFSYLEYVNVIDVDYALFTSPGRPSDGGLEASVANAKTYVENSIQHMKTGTPKRPGLLKTKILQCLMNQKPPGVEQHLGLFRSNESPVYSVNFDAN